MMEMKSIEGMSVESKPCHFRYEEVLGISLPVAKPARRGPLCYYRQTLKSCVFHISLFGLFGYDRYALRSLKLDGSRIPPVRILGRLIAKKEETGLAEPSEVLDLQPGEWVEVRSAKEILATLDQTGRLKGLGIMSEMVKFCGKRFKVYKRVERIMLETTGEMRRIRTPTVLLEGVFCDGRFHRGCDRSCFCYWREAWLKRVEPK